MPKEIRPIKAVDESLYRKIYEVRTTKVMLDRDLALLYQVETKRINEAVSRNMQKFPDRFSWLATESDIFSLRSQNAAANIDNMSRVAPRLFTEQGVYMLATILRSEVATEVSIAIMDAFVAMRKNISYASQILPRDFKLLERKVDQNAERINELFDRFNSKSVRKDYLFFDGQIYDAHSLLLDIFKMAKDEIIIIDNYISKDILDILKNLKIWVKSVFILEG